MSPEPNIVEVWSRKDLENPQPSTEYRIMCPIPDDEEPRIVFKDFERVELAGNVLAPDGGLYAGGTITTGPLKGDE
jgi:hypothetical protein